MASNSSATPTAELYDFSIPIFNANSSAPQYTTVAVPLDVVGLQSQLYFSGGDIAWMITASMLVWLMVPGLSFFYGGIAHPNISLSMTWLPLMTASLVGVQWYLWGYAITFSNWPPSFIITDYWGAPDGVALHNDLLRPVPARSDNHHEGPYIPEILYVLFEGMFAQFTAALVAGGAAWRDTPGIFLIFILFWATFVYDPIARSTWNAEGISNKFGSLDFAGGSAVHICAGATVFAHGFYHEYILERWESILGRVKAPTKGGQGSTLRPEEREIPRLESHEEAEKVKKITDKVTNYNHILLGTVLLWLGWFGFNGGSALGASVRAVSACVSTHVAAFTGGVFHCLCHAFWKQVVEQRRQKRPAVQEELPQANPHPADQGHGPHPTQGAPPQDPSDQPQGFTNGGDAVLDMDPSAPEAAPESNGYHQAGNGVSQGVKAGPQPSAVATAQPEVYVPPAFRFSVLEFCNGAIIGLVAITPAAGYIPHQYAPLFGIVPSLFCVVMHWLNNIVPDAMYIAVIHGVGGLVGMIMTGIFARGDIAALDGFTPRDACRGAIDGYPAQIGKQTADAFLVLAYALFMTLAILVFLEIPIFFFRGFKRGVSRQNLKDPAFVNLQVKDSKVLFEGSIQDQQDLITRVLAEKRIPTF